MAWTITAPTREAINQVLARVSAACANLRGDGSLADAALSRNIPRYADLAPRPFTPVGSAGAGTFTIGSVTLCTMAMLSPVLMLVAVSISACSLSAVTNTVSIQVPFGYRIKETGWGNALSYSDNGTVGTGRVRAGKDGTTFDMRMDVLAAGNWQAPTAISAFAFEAIFFVYK